ncbi:MAG: hypothetical protein COB49_00605 [Alphaproteobacteria bacterium]|nr:MAG: hypothetical protein COB49_00605 [Alphaproteobacteria bacterium]
MKLPQSLHSAQLPQLPAGRRGIQFFQGLFDLIYFHIVSIAGAMRLGFPHINSGGRLALPQPLMASDRSLFWSRAMSELSRRARFLSFEQSGGILT